MKHVVSATHMQRLVSAVSRGSFLVGGGFLFIGIHRFIFGAYPKLIWVRDLPWDRVSYEWCFAAALGLALAGGWLGRAAHRARKAAFAVPTSMPVSVGPPVLEPPGAQFKVPAQRPVSEIVPPSAQRTLPPTGDLRIAHASHAPLFESPAGELGR